MTDFLIIAADNSLHYIVDDIEKCRPRNMSLPVHISTGKIEKKKSGYEYFYTNAGETNRTEKGRCFCELLSNQLANFRLVNHIPQNSLVNVFFLENPLTKEEFEQHESWMVELDAVFREGQGQDTNFRLMRVLFTYNIEDPCDVNPKIAKADLKRLLDQHRNAVKRRLEESVFLRYLFYVDNQKSDEQALSSGKDEHKLKMPRLLTDFMMLVSDVNNTQRIMLDIQSDTYSFSVGVAESMYYYPDVERYFVMADARDMNEHLLDDDDEVPSDTGLKSMDIEAHPFGLRARRDRLKELYQDVPFSEDIENHPKTADYLIEQSLRNLKELLVKEREQEIEEYRNQVNNESEDEDSEGNYPPFTPQCPEYTDRERIYVLWQRARNGEDQQLVLEEKQKQYDEILDFVESDQFYSFVSDVPDDPLDESGIENELSRRKGCWGRIKSWWHRDKVDASQTTPTEESTTQTDDPESWIKTIVQQRNLKRKYQQFAEKVKALEDEYDQQKKDCDNFRLTDHDNHFQPLIVLEKLCEEHTRLSSVRWAEACALWHQKEEPTRTSLKALIDILAKEYTATHYAYIDWENPFSFVYSFTDKTLADTCNELQKRSSPFVNYNIITDSANQVGLVKRLYSDRPKFGEEIQAIKNKGLLTNGNVITDVETPFIASKLIMLQLLPISEDIMDNLVDLYGTVYRNEPCPGEQSNEAEEEKSEIPEENEEQPKTEQSGSETAPNPASDEPHVVDWGEKG